MEFRNKEIENPKSEGVVSGKFYPLLILQKVNSLIQMSVLDKMVSYYPSVKATTQGRNVNLLTILRSDKHKDLIQNLRCSDEQARKIIKETLPCFTLPELLTAGARKV